MRDNADDKLDRLFSAARSERLDISAREAHFETRLMARLAERRAQRRPWRLLIWRTMPAFAVMAVLSIACSLVFDPTRSEDPFAVITVAQEDGLYRNVLAGE
jgi:anti-sigma-K factor RskA